MAAVYALHVEGVGDFQCSRRTNRVQMALLAEVARLTAGLDIIPGWLRDYTESYALLKVLVLRGPDGWALDDMDASDPATYETMLKVVRAITAKEVAFRQGGTQDSTATGTGAVGAG